jgi:hypothetical protein
MYRLRCVRIGSLLLRSEVECKIARVDRALERVREGPTALLLCMLKSRLLDEQWDAIMKEWNDEEEREGGESTGSVE